VCEWSVKYITADMGDAFEKKRVKSRVVRVSINNALVKWAIGTGEGRGPTWPIGSQHVNSRRC
jgi:hypothetical protein